jgi:tRNA-binding protein
MTQKAPISWEDFNKIDMRVGTVISASPFEKAHKPAYQLSIDFGAEIGFKKTSAQITELYNVEELIGKKVVAVVNFPPKQIANFMSECLILGSVDGTKVSLLHPDHDVTNGLSIS